MARRGRKRKPGERYESGRLIAQPERPATVYVEARRRAAIDGQTILVHVSAIEGGTAKAMPEWRNKECASLIGTWLLRGQLDRDADMAADMMHAAESYRACIARMRFVIEARGVKAVAHGMARGSAPEVTEEEYRRAHRRYDERYAVVRRCGHHVALAVRAALDDDTGANLEHVRTGLRALVDAGLT